MWSESVDPGGSKDPNLPSDTTAAEDLQAPQDVSSDIQKQFEEQQQIISNLKDMLAKPEPSKIPKEKVEEYANALSNIKSRAKSKIKKGSGSQIERQKISQNQGKRGLAGDSAKEKLSLLQQQIQENKAKLAQRSKHEKGLEEMVTQLKAQLEETESVLTQSSSITLNLSHTEDHFKPFEYDEKSSKEELLKALNMRETHLQDMSAKLRSLEANILDLQEGLKEKDSVIDARTKAITLMSENLSKKNKTTLDMLDETKEQMFSMQQKFIGIEAEMKHQINVLKVELQNRDRKIDELNEIIESSQVPTKSDDSLQSNSTKELIEEYEEKMKNQQELYEVQIKELKNQIKENEKEKTSQTNQLSSDEKSVEIAKLNQKLDEMNKNLIKSKAQYKNKLKELQNMLKNADSKISDNELLKENADLKIKIASLEEITKLSETELIHELNMTVEKCQLEADKYKKENDKLNLEIKGIQDKMMQMSQLENAQMCSELATIQLEEQLDQLTAEVKSLTDQMQQIQREKQQLVDQNLELLDRLDKLSAEKVSSAESIEFVEPLTQQERLELEAYQRQAELAAAPRRDSLQNQDLNESVTKLSEESSELLAKIEMFNTERREVIDKLDQLTNENRALQVKLAELSEEKEKNLADMLELKKSSDELRKQLELVEDEKRMQTVRFDSIVAESNDLKSEFDSLVQLYDVATKRISTLENQTRSPSKKGNAAVKNLQEEMAIYKKMVEDQKAQIKLLSEKCARNDELENCLSNAMRNQERAEAEVSTITENRDSLLKIIEDLQSEVDMLRQSAHFSEEFEIRTCKEMEELKLIIENNQSVILASSETISSLQTIINDKESDLTSKDNEIAHLKHTIEDMETTLKRVEFDHASNKENNDLMVQQIGELKNMVHQNQEDLKQYEDEIKRSSKIIEDLNKQINMMNERIVETQFALDGKEEEVKLLKAETERKENLISHMRQEYEAKEASFNQLINELREKSSSLESQAQGNFAAIRETALPLETKINQLETKNKEQLEKIKKLAANLKKKTIMCQELEDKLSELMAKNEENCKEKENLQNQLFAQNEQTSSFETKLASLQSQLAAAVTSSESDSEVEILKTQLKDNQVLIEKLHEDLRNASAQSMKLQEQAMVIENLEEKLSAENNKLWSLEEKLMSALEEKGTLEAKMVELQASVQGKDGLIEELNQREVYVSNELESFKNAYFSAEQKATQFENSNQYLVEENRSLQEKCDHFVKEIRELNDKLADYSTCLEKYSELQKEILELRTSYDEVVKQFNITNKKLEKELQKSKNEVDNMESELNIQLVQLDSERKQLRETCEKAEDALRRSMSEEEILQNENAELKQAMEALNAECDALKQQLVFSREQSSDKQVSYLQQLLAAKEQELEGYRQQQSTDQAPVFSYYQKNDENSQQAEIDILQEKLREKDQEIVNIRKELEDLRSIQAFNQIQSVAEAKTIDVIQRARDQINAEGLAEEHFTKKSYHDSAVEPSQQNISFEIEQKVRTLEFMLFTAEKERDEALSQVAGLTEELTKIIYKEQQNKELSLAQREIDLSSLAEQIVTGDDQVDRSALQKLEFEPTGDIVSGITYDRKTPVDEKPADSKHAYLCYDDIETPAGDWGEDADVSVKREVTHVQTAAVSSSAPGTDIHKKMDALTAEKDTLSVQLKDSQLKCAKLMKKLKEFKTKNDQLTTKLKEQRSAGGLDTAIEEELLIKIEELEKKMSEMTSDVKNMTSEKEKLLKRIDVLTAANERMTELKEKQDSDIMYYQQKAKDMEAKLGELEWSSFGESKEAKIESTKAESEHTANMEVVENRIKELNETINELTLDNEELQTLLEEQRRLRIEAEKSVHVDRTSAEEYQQITLERNQALEKVKSIESAIETAIADRDAAYREIEELKSIKLDRDQAIEKLKNTEQALENAIYEKKSMQSDLEELKSIILEKDQIIEKIKSVETALEITINERDIALRELEEMKCLQNPHPDNYEMQEMINKVTLLENQIEYLQGQLNEVSNNYSQISTSYNELMEEKYSLLKKIDELNGEYEMMVQCKTKFESTLSNANIEIEKLREDYNKLRTEYSFSQDENLAIKAENDKTIAEIKDAQHQIEIQKEEIVRLENMRNIIEDKIAEKNKEVEELKIKLDEEIEKRLKIESQLQEISDKMMVASDDKSTAALEERIKELEGQNAELKSEHEKQLAALSEEWVNKVEERGYLVANTWKEHLEMRDSIIQQMTMQLEELQSQYTALKNENTMLKDNKDLSFEETSNRLEETQSKLATVLQEKENLVQSKQSIASELEALKALVCEKESQENELKNRVESLQLQLEASIKETEYLSRIRDELKAQTAILSTENIALKQNTELSNEESNKELSELKVKYEELLNENITLMHTKEHVEQMKLQIQELENKNKILFEENTSLKQHNDTVSKETAEILKELESQYISVSNENTELKEKLSQSTQGREEFEKINAEVENLRGMLQQAQTSIEQWSVHSQDLTKRLEDAHRDVFSLKETILEKEEEIMQLQQASDKKIEETSEEFQTIIQQLHTSIADKEKKIEDCKRQLNDNTNYYEDILSAKDLDIENLNVQLGEKVRLHEYVLAQEKDVLEQLTTKDNECEELRKQLTAINDEMQEVKNQVEEKMVDCKNLINEIQRLNELKDTNSKQLSALTEAHEEMSTELELVKQQLAEKEIQYDALNSKLEMYHQAKMKEVEAAGAKGKPPVTDELAEPASRAELDLALYMLHQRDVRCEELTVELVHLLEERDTLQLRLSNAMRVNEELKTKLPDDEATKQAGASTNLSETSNLSLELGTDAVELVKSPDSLAAKISQLHNVDYRKDVRVKDEQEARRLQQASLMQQHIEVASLLPSEAAERLVNANYTLSRDVQSTPKVILNWLWGRSTPKEGGT